MGKPDRVETPEFLEVKRVGRDNPLFYIRRTPLGELLTQYQGVVLEYYDNVVKYGKLTEDQAYVEEDQYNVGTEQQRQRWRQAGRQKALWDRLSVYNGELLRRIYAGRLLVVDMLKTLESHVEHRIMLDGADTALFDEDDDSEESEAFPTGHES